MTLASMTAKHLVRNMTNKINAVACKHSHDSAETNKKKRLSSNLIQSYAPEKQTIVYACRNSISCCVLYFSSSSLSARLGAWWSRRLPGSMPTIHSQIAAGHKATGVTDQENSCATVFFGARQTTQHILLGPFVATFGKLHE